jgi:hypothetical protein
LGKHRREARVICKVYKVVFEDISRQSLVVKILGPRQLRYARFKAALHCVSGYVICSPIPAMREQELAVSQAFLSEILQIRPVHSTRIEYTLLLSPDDE